MNNLSKVFEVLKLNTSNGLYYLNEPIWKSILQLPNRILNLFENEIKPDAFFCLDNKPLILFYENPEDKKELHKNIWNFNDTPIVIIVEDNNITIYNGFRLQNSGENKGFLNKIGDENALNDFNYFELVTGKTWEKHKDELNHKNRVDYNLLNNIKDARALMIEILQKSAKKQSIEFHTKIVNALLGKIIFIRYLIDRKILITFNNETRIWLNTDLCELLKDSNKTKVFFTCLSNKENGFNGDLFPITEDEYKIITRDVYEILIRLLKSESIGSKQPSLFDLYDFSVIPVEFISNVYESFVGVENQDKEGIYYTPLFLVDYILSKTVGEFVSANKTYNCKVLDPACGSGIFLVEVLRKLIEQYKIQNTNLKKATFKEDIKKIVTENIYGIDKDKSAIEVAIFSIYLTLLSEMEPPDIASFKFPELLNTNFFCEDYFDINAGYNTIFKSLCFDFIVGNPPWSRGKNEKQRTGNEPLFIQYLQNRKKIEKSFNYKHEVDIGNKEIAQAFLLRNSDFSNSQTRCSLIITSKVLYNLQSKNFRQYFLQNFKIERVFELAPVRREVFTDRAVAPACVLFYKYSFNENTDENIIEHIALKPSRFFSLFNIFSLSIHDIKQVQQDRFKKYDWIWKTLVYGSYLDFRFINKMNKLSRIGNVIKQNKMIFKQGLKRKDGEKIVEVSELVGKSFIDTTKKQLKPFRIIDTEIKWDKANVGYIYTENGKPYFELFQPYSLLIIETLNNDFTSNAAINHKENVFTSSIRALKIHNKEHIDMLYSINTVLCSSLFSYYALYLCSSIGIEREQTQDKEIEEMWFLQIPDAIKRGKLIEEHETQKNIIKCKVIEELSVKEQCDNIIMPILSLSDEEKALLDYANNIIIPIQMRHDNHEKLFDIIMLEDEILIDYANLFFDYFKSSFESVEKKFIIEICLSQHLIGMFFKVISESEYQERIIWKQQSYKEMFALLTHLGNERITDNLFIQKDIRGFDEDYFYICKPNEKRLWHKAIGYLDAEEFMHLILQEGNKGK
ncbi:MAG: N-6 DNA methylase [Candidatus Cloacimonetes bacterium]|nr:N-6 DNA methylase [Candidatus Cloacimonadota bacterium]